MLLWSVPGIHPASNAQMGNNRTKPNTLCITCNQAPGDVVMTTAAVRDLKKLKPELTIGVDTRYPELWYNNPYITPMNPRDRWVNKLTVDYTYYLNQSNRVPGHFVGAIHKFLGSKLGYEIPLTEPHGDIHITEDEKEAVPVTEEPYWIIICGGKTDFTTKWWNPSHAQAVVDHYKGKFKFVQVGDKRVPNKYPEHVHFPLNNVIDMIGKTSIRELIKLIYNAQGVICPVTFSMHLAAAIKCDNGSSPRCVVVAGGREPPHWEAYAGHRFLDTIGKFDCCMTGGCWARRAQLWKDAQNWNTRQLCKRPIQTDKLVIAECMNSIGSSNVIEAIDSYYKFVDITVTK